MKREGTSHKRVMLPMYCREVERYFGMEMTFGKLLGGSSDRTIMTGGHGKNAVEH